eukprot:3240468-Amphidinium_carterae.2
MLPSSPSCHSILRRRSSKSSNLCAMTCEVRDFRKCPKHGVDIELDSGMMQVESLGLSLQLQKRNAIPAACMILYPI